MLPHNNRRTILNIVVTRQQFFSIQVTTHRGLWTQDYIVRQMLEPLLMGRVESMRVLVSIDRPEPGDLETRNWIHVWGVNFCLTNFYAVTGIAVEPEDMDDRGFIKDLWLALL